MGSAPVRLLAIDIDGTLLDSSYRLPPANVAALRRAHEAGVEIVLATGRRHTFALPVAQELGFDVWLISSNGAVTRSSSGQVFHRDLMPLSTARALLRHMEDFRANTVITFDREGKGALVVEHTDELAVSIARWIEKNQQYFEFVQPISRALTADPVQVMFGGGVARMQQALEHVKAADFTADITVLRTQYDHRDLCFIDVLNRDCSKGHALRRWAAERGISREHIMAIGDNYNDVEMLEAAGLPVIMGNASADLRARGWALTLTADEAGVAHAVEAVLTGRLGIFSKLETSDSKLGKL